jgi:hypothetical protein
MIAHAQAWNPQEPLRIYHPMASCFVLGLVFFPVICEDKTGVTELQVRNALTPSFFLCSPQPCAPHASLTGFIALDRAYFLPSIASWTMLAVFNETFDARNFTFNPQVTSISATQVGQEKPISFNLAVAATVDQVNFNWVYIYGDPEASHGATAFLTGGTTSCGGTGELVPQSALSSISIIVPMGFILQENGSALPMANVSAIMPIIYQSE